jgi:hypothetical protein
MKSRDDHDASDAQRMGSIWGRQMFRQSTPSIWKSGSCSWTPEHRFAKTGMRLIEKEPGTADGKMGPGEGPRGTMIEGGSYGFALRSNAAG